jgi:hypothetical protein
MTVAFRIFMAIPHLIVWYVWRALAQILGFVQWFIILFTGQRNEGIWRMQQGYLYYYSRVVGYLSLLFDQYPAFGTDPGTVPVRSNIDFEGPANRLTNGLRFIWIIPAAIIAAVLGIASGVLVLISWFAILFTGKHPRGMWEFILKVERYTLQTDSYGLLMTDTYPKYGEGVPPATPSMPLPPPMV